MRGPQVAWLELQCDGWQDAGLYPSRYLFRSPSCRWSEAGARMRSFALVLEDLDARPGEPRVHWLVYDLPEDARELPGGLTPGEEPPGGGDQGRNDRGGVGFAPPVRRNGSPGPP